MAIIDKPTDYFNTKLTTGTGSSQAVTGLGFQPDWIWGKRRDSTGNNSLFDSVRGITKGLESNSTGAEFTSTDYYSSFDSDGFTIAAGASGAGNGSGQTAVQWCWKAGTSVSGDTTGSGTLKTYTGSVNTTSGFSIIKYTGNGTAGHTIPHHLGVAPSAIFVKKLNELGDWSSYHSVLGNAGYMRLNNTNAFATASTYWNNTSPTSSVFTTGTTGNINGSGSTYIAYCFAEKQGYSKFGSYTGNGSTDGTFVYLGFKPAWVVIKRSSAVSDWHALDNKRAGFNADNDYLKLNQPDTEGTDGDRVDFLSNGFKLRHATGNLNESGNTFIYMAFASEPFTTSTGVCATAR